MTLVNRFRGHPVKTLRCRGGSVDCRHRHRAAYLSIVLEGEETEAGEEGRSRLGPGDVSVHRAFDAHCNYVGRRGILVLNLPWPETVGMPPVGHLSDADAIVRIAEYDAAKASAAVVEAMVPKSDRCSDWPDLLGDNLRDPNGLSLYGWAHEAGLAPESLSRGFKKLYGVSPARYRWEFRARNAWRQIIETDLQFADISLSCGFADQSHMSRAIRALTGSSPSNWRKQQLNLFKTPVTSSA